MSFISFTVHRRAVGSLFDAEVDGDRRMHISNQTR
jgi:hypothetical protein